MTSDSTISDIESNENLSDISTVSDVEETSTHTDVESDPILPDAEIDSVISYLKSDAAQSDIEFFDSPLPENTVNNNIQVQFKTEGEKLLLILPTELQVPPSDNNWSEIWQQVKLRLLGRDRFFSPNTSVHLIAQNRLLDGRQLQELAETLSEAQMQLRSVSTSRRQTAIAAVSSGYSVEQLQPETSLSSEAKATKPLAEALYLEMTVRSGVEFRHPGPVIILGDLNPGGIVVADGDILVWGRLRGIAHAGASGNRESIIMALQMEPTQLRIADAVARAPEKSPMQYYPEVAHITPQGIRITRAIDFSRIQFSKINQEL
ncbi:septum site-determining protein MinC [Aetokthonos hydrillicola Thurmond2011]|jgi:septum site-determining protein MinC|uniref:Probable septum site-determining protein MinC n=1 Tax=Aetokthonos hydrillicola Thurmond2011 TaxID=2712845 RepID=A0AAP5MED9_9CYAN|nr:septum site-determining protein MinC [Aetokthonos hydrillicola]MBO3461001.1 septum site-determining protein MinC [Aetokthonos hydrillicola CCALA 1050]MBW4588430.1 septum site-determining protein MinC [Aetokthonos hydrillicola CCALA 1050]MDR9900799.1 septum site-determining protein MinC [Aetokthonos hydrillicola Thurmond2011]